MHKKIHERWFKAWMEQDWGPNRSLGWPKMSLDDSLLCPDASPWCFGLVFWPDTLAWYFALMFCPGTLPWCCALILCPDALLQRSVFELWVKTPVFFVNVTFFYKNFATKTMILQYTLSVYNGDMVINEGVNFCHFLFLPQIRWPLAD